MFETARQKLGIGMLTLIPGSQVTRELGKEADLVYKIGRQVSKEGMYCTSGTRNGLSST
jgi:hypothetical protein